MMNEALQINKMAKYEKALKHKEILSGRISSVEEHAPFGKKMACAIVELDHDLKGMIYESQFDTQQYRSLVGFVDHTIDFMVLDVTQHGLSDDLQVFDKENGIVLLSRVQALETMRESFWSMPDEELIDHVTHGTVSGFEDRAMYIHVNGVDCFLAKKDFDYEWNESMRKKLPLGAKVTVKITEIDRAKNRVVVSRKELMENPWNRVHENFGVGNFHSGTVVNVVQNIGVFVRMKAGIHALCWFPRRMPEGSLLGKSVTVRLKSINKEGQRMAGDIVHFPHEVY